MKAIAKSLGDFLVDRTESLENIKIEEYFVQYSKDKITRLLDTEQYIFEGSRGIGKTMLMKYASIQANKSFGQDSILSVWISFEESIRLERIKVVGDGVDPFLQWTMGKILHEVLKSIISLKPRSMDQLSGRLSKIFCYPATTNFEQYSKLLSEYLDLLEKGDIRDSLKLMEEAPSSELSKILDNPGSFKKFLLGLVNDFELNRIVLLFDEAAHVFSHIQQEKFFTFFKSLRDPKIACKAAVYPGITNYGKYFEKGQDAKELSIEWSPTIKGDIDYIKDILKKRILTFGEDAWRKLNENPEIINTICVCSNGNPRFAFHIIDELDSSGAFTWNRRINMQLVKNSVRKVLDSKWKEFTTLKNRLVKYSKYIDEAEKLVKEFLVKNLRDWNSKRIAIGKSPSAGFYVATSLYEKIPQVFEVLAYSNLIIIDYRKKSIGHGHYGYYMMLNPSILIADLILETNDFQKVSVAIENNQAYYLTTNHMADLVNMLKESNEYNCTNSSCNFKTDNEDFKFCPSCGNPIEIPQAEPLYKILRSHSVESLKLSDSIIRRLKEKFSTVGEIYDATIDDIRMPYIQDVRAVKVKTAAIEYMAG